MKKKSLSLKMTGSLIISFIVFTLLVMTYDVKEIGPQKSLVGFASINKYVYGALGNNMIWNHITEWIGLLALIVMGIYGLIGFMQLFQRKSISKVDKDIIALGCVYTIILSLYVFFENIIINYRPIMSAGVLEASYPSTHIMIILSVLGTSFLQRKWRYRENKPSKYYFLVFLSIAVIVVFGRLLSGVHWLTDIIGGILLASICIALYYCALKRI